MVHYNKLIVSASDAEVLALAAGGAQRSVVVVHANKANATERRVSVFSPVGRALLGIRALNVGKVATALEEAS